MTADPSVLLGDERDDEIVMVAKIVDEPGLSTGAAMGLATLFFFLGVAAGAAAMYLYLSG